MNRQGKKKATVRRGLGGCFTVRIQMGTEAMLTPADVSGALSRLVEKLNWPEWEGKTHGRITDRNGKTVGEWWHAPKGGA